jgi:uncharacterized protein (DUF1800 family)
MQISMPWTEQHVRRLFWRAGFGASPEEAARWAKAGQQATIRWIMNGGGGPELKGPPPRVHGAPLDPVNEYGHAALWWLDRMVRTQRPLVEKMTLFWHDHFSTRGVEWPLMLAQNRMLRRGCLGRFPTLLTNVTRDSAMQIFLSLANSDKLAPNENYARELMELFTLGHGYSENDVRQAARALTGFRSKWTNAGFRGIHYEAKHHDDGMKRIFGKRGRFDWHDVVRLVTSHPAHAPFLVEKLWAYFITAPLDGATRKQLLGTYRRSKLTIKPVVEEILRHPALYGDLDHPDMIKSPTVFLAAALRQVGGGVQAYDWAWLMDHMGQMPFSPPSVAGWDWGPAWLSTNTVKSRFQTVTYLFATGTPIQVRDGSTPVNLTAAEAVARARAAVGDPWTSPETNGVLERMAASYFSGVNPRQTAAMQKRADQREVVLRHLLLSGPDAQLH